MGTAPSLEPGLNRGGESSIQISDKVVEAVTKSAEAVTKVGSIGGQVQSLLTEVSLVKTEALSAKSDANTAKADASGAKAKSEDLVRRVELTASQLEEAKKQLTQLDRQIVEELAKISREQIEKLSTLKDDRAKFDQELQAQLASLNLTDAQIKALQEKAKGLTTEEVIGLLIAAGAGGALGKTGKSRAQPQIDKVREDVNRLMTGRGN